jgi:hypothetical protein
MGVDGTVEVVTNCKGYDGTKEPFVPILVGIISTMSSPKIRRLPPELKAQRKDLSPVMYLSGKDVSACTIGAVNAASPSKEP